MVLRLALLPVIFVAALRSCSPAPPVTEASASAFSDGVGVNTHLEYLKSSYADLPRVTGALRVLGVRRVRDAAFRAGAASLPRFEDVALVGVRFDLFFSRDLTSQLYIARSLERRVPGAIVQVEGPNEINNEGFGQASAGDVQAAQSYQETLYQRVHAGAIEGLPPVLNFTDWPPSSGRADFANFHSYPWPSSLFASRLARDRDLGKAVLPRGAPVVCSETGFNTLGDRSVSLEQQANLTLLLLLENFRAGVAQTYLYELLDEGSDGARAAANGENHFGLFYSNGQPKPAAIRLGHLMGLLAERGASARPTTKLKIEVVGARYLILHRADGVAVVLIWEGSRGGRQHHLFSYAITSPGASVARFDLQSGARTPLKQMAGGVGSGTASQVVVLIAAPRARLSDAAPRSRAVETRFLAK